jgi:lipopolysaccharide export system permease protein
LLTAAGIFLVARKNRDKSLLLSRLDRWIRERLWGGLLHLRRPSGDRHKLRAQAQPAAKAPDLVLRFPRPDLRFPYLIDRYVLREFSWIFALVMLSAMTVYLVGDMTGTIHDASQNGVSGGVVADYYKYFSLQIFYDICPVIVLITTLITFSLFSRSNEITAWKGLGLSLYRLSVPAIVAAAGVAALLVFLQSQVLPFSNQRVAQLKDTIEGRESVRTYSRADRQWVFGQDRFIYNYLHYDQRRKTLQRLQIFEFDENRNIVRRLVAASARHAGGDAWVFTDSWSRSFEGGANEVQVADFRLFPGEITVHLPVTPEYFDSEIRPPEHMRYGELKRYVRDLKESGQQVPELEVQLYNKISYPVISLVMCLVALPFAFRLGRHGALYGIGLSVVLGLVFMATFALCTTLGEAGALPPLVAVWSPNLLFGFFAVYLFLGVRT